TKISDMASPVPTLPNADFTSAQLFGIHGINRRDEPCSPTGFNPRGGRSIATVETLAETCFALICPAPQHTRGVIPHSQPFSLKGRGESFLTPNLSPSRGEGSHSSLPTFLPQGER